MQSQPAVSVKYIVGALTFLAATVIFGVATASTPSDDSSGAQQSLGINSSFGKWSGGVISWVYNSTGAPQGWTDDVFVLGEFQKALDEWQGVCGVVFVGRGIDDTAVNGGAADGEVVFEWDSSIGSSSGQAGPNWAESAQILTDNGLYPYTDGGLKMNPNSFGIAGGSTAAQIEQIELQFNNTAVHELGHLIGFGHSDNPVSRMYANPYNSLSHLRQDDVDGCVSLYGKPFLYVPPPKHVALAAGVSPFNSIFLASSENTDLAITSIDNEEDWDLAVNFQYQAAAAEDLEIKSVIVDPQGFKNIVSSRIFSLPSAGLWSAWFTMTNFDRMRQLPGTWTIQVIVNNELVSSLPIDVNTSLPDYNEPPTATFAVYDNPTTREISATVDVTGDGDIDTQNVSIIWHVPTVGAPRVDLSAATGSDTQAVDYNDLASYEIFAEIVDDGPRYVEDLPNNVGPAGSGFQKLFRYVSRDKTVLGDSDGDKTSDVVLRNMATGADHLYKMNGTTITQSVGIDTVSDLNWKIEGRGDYNADGNSDILWRHAVSGTIYIYFMDGQTIQASLPVGTVSNLDWQIVGDGDYNGDGYADILWHDSVNGTVWLYQMVANVVFLSTGVGTVPDLDWQIFGSGDYDGDGCADILWRNVVSGTNWMYLMNGPSIMTSIGVSVAPDTNWEIVANGDYNGDSRSDILWRHAVSGTNWVYLMNGTTIQSSASISVLPDANWIVVGDGDYNGDGKADVLWRNLSTGSNWMYLMDGLSITSSANISTVTDQNWEIIH